MDLAMLESRITAFHTKHVESVESLRIKLDEESDRRQKLEQEVIALKAMPRGGAPEGRDPLALKAFDAFLRTGNDNAMAQLTKTMAGVSANDGAAVLPTQIDAEIARVLRDLNPMRRLCTIVQASTATYKKVVTQKNTASAWVGETDARPATTTPSLQAVSVPIGEQYANAPVSQQLIDDAFTDVGTLVIEEAAATFADAEAAAFVSGDGTNKPRGFLSGTINTTGDATRTFGQIEYVPTGVAGGLPATAAATYDFLNDLLFRLRAP